MQFHATTSGSCPEKKSLGTDVTGQELLCSDLPHRVEEVKKKKRELKAVFEVMANLAGDVEAPVDDGGCG